MKRLVIGMLLAISIVFAWQWFIAYLYERNPQWERPWEERVVDEPAEPVEPPAVEAPPQPPPAVAPDVQPPTEVARPDEPPVAPPPAIDAPALRAAPAAEPETVHLGSDAVRDPAFRMGIALSPRGGGGIERVVLNDYSRAIDTDEPFLYQQPYPLRPETTRPLQTQSITVDGVTVNLAEQDWQLDGEPAADSATYSIDIVSDDGPVLRVRKHFQLQPPDHPSRGYEVTVRQSFQNLANRPLSISTVFNGPTTPPREMTSLDDRQIITGYWDQGYIQVGHFFAAQLTPEEPARQILLQGNLPMAWAGASSVYFNAIIRPQPLEPGNPVPVYFESVQAEAINPDSPPDDRQVVMTFHTSELALDAGADLELPLQVFFGPKRRALLLSDYYMAMPLGYHHTLKTVGQGCGAVCTFDWLITSLVWLLGAFYALFRDWGLAIIGLVAVVRVALHPITKRSTISMHKMGKMAPEMERLKKKYGDNKEELNKAMMQFYKEQGFTPILGCLPMFLQMPIWIALWSALQNTFELRHAPLLYGFTWVQDLARPDQLITWPPVPLFFGISISALNVLPLLLAVVFYLQHKFMPKPAAATKEQLQQQKMMQWMVLLFPIFLYNAPSGLNLYILTSTTIGIIESKRIRDHIKAKEEADKAERVLVEARPTRGSRKARQEPPPEPKRGGIMGWLAELQEKVEQMRREGNRRGKDRA